MASITTGCCIAGGGPAGMMLGYLLARAGVDVVVLEKHADFFRDFRGDTIHPSTLALMDELGLLDALLQRPHSEARQLGARFGDVALPIADFDRVPGRCKFIAFMPQWDFLSFIAERARAFSSFALEMEAEATDLIWEGERVAGVVARTPHGALVVRAQLVVGADGRHSVLRERAQFVTKNLGAPIDVLWMRVSRRPNDPGQAFGNFGAGGLLVLIDRGEYFQCGLVIAKDGYDTMRMSGIETLRAQVAALAPFLRDRLPELRDWDDVKLLTVTVDRLRRWYRDGMLCIGDAAHAMSPVGGVGINLAIQDAVAAANVLARPLRGAGARRHHLRAIERRRQLPTKLTQAMQLFVQNRLLRPLLATRNIVKPPLLLRVVAAVPALRRIPARIIGVGFRPERPRAIVVRGCGAIRPSAARLPR
ncbi:MAG: FAD-dependent oxidoreductase [Candidatus Eremiobacteraeota bacterium]|nr:FAD-dependent oxidoreductase [Candidatus Eremiobacteraeota bacterium]